MIRERLNAGGNTSLDLIARKVIMSAVLYYGLGKPIVSDAEFDGWCKKLAKNWDKLDRYQQWQLGSPEEIKSSAFHVKVSWASAGGAHSWLTSTGVTERFQITYTRPPRRSKRYQVDWWTPEDFVYTALADKKPVKTKRKRIRLEQQKKSKRIRVRLFP